ncbi:MAG TPA: GGDEF domain-containing protein [Alphaproteobacteria bacterium]|nr:GGDEF domain-containing protein [Alphaproteobacteria bacterium]
MHRAAREALGDMQRQGRVDPEHYDRYKRLQQQLVTALESLENKIHVLDCPTDPLTGVCARQGMTRRLREEQNRSERLGQRVSLVMLDLDHFKRINDTYGHQAGDRVLRAAAQRVLRALRPYDRMYRYGGEEFLLCLSDTDTQRAAEVAERLREALARRPIRLGDGRALDVRGSFGVTELHPGESVEQAIRRADQALYAAKAGGRNQVRVAERE